MKRVKIKNKNYWRAKKCERYYSEVKASKRINGFTVVFIYGKKRQVCALSNDSLKDDEISYVITVNSFADWNMPRTMQAVEVIADTVGQYTGLTDRNGRKIFEGDIVNILTENEEFGIITYDDGGFFVDASTFSVDFMNNINGSDIEVIDNIHDNPKALKNLNQIK